MRSENMIVTITTPTVSEETRARFLALMEERLLSDIMYGVRHTDGMATHHYQGIMTRNEAEGKADPALSIMPWRHHDVDRGH